MKLVIFFNNNLFNRNLSKTILIYFIYFFKILKYINISSKYITAKISKYFIKILLIIA